MEEFLYGRKGETHSMEIGRTSYVVLYFKNMSTILAKST